MFFNKYLSKVGGLLRHYVSNAGIHPALIMLNVVTINDEQMISGLLKKRKQVMGYILETRNDLAKLGEDLRPKSYR